MINAASSIARSSGWNGSSFVSSMWYDALMAKSLDRKPKPKAKADFTLGRQGFAKISAVEGVYLSPAMEDQFREFDRQGLSPAERRKAIARAFGKAR